MPELSDDDVKTLFAEGYYVINCDICDRPVGCFRVLGGYDFTYDETLCFDCAYNKLQRMKDNWSKVYG